MSVAYLVTEVILALPTFAMFVLLAIVRPSPSHGLSLGELTIPFAISLVVTVLPLTLAIRSLRNR
jgi:hypothetical protein